MAYVEFAYHLAYQVGEVIAVSDIREQLRIFFIYMIPVGSVHVLDIEAVAGDSPAFVEDLSPLGFVVHGDAGIPDGHACRSVRRAAEVHDLVVRTAAHEGLGCVGREGDVLSGRAVAYIQSLEVEDLELASVGVPELVVLREHESVGVDRQCGYAVLYAFEIHFGDGCRVRLLLLLTDFRSRRFIFV